MCVVVFVFVFKKGSRAALEPLPLRGRNSARHHCLTLESAAGGGDSEPGNGSPCLIYMTCGNAGYSVQMMYTRFASAFRPRLCPDGQEMGSMYQCLTG